MAMELDFPNVSLLAEALRAEASADPSPESLVALLQDPNQVMQEPSQTVTSLALAQGWSFPGVAADSASEGSASSETVQPSSEPDADAATLAKLEEPAPDPASLNSTGSEGGRTEVPTHGSTTTETATETLTFKDTQTLGSVEEKESDGESEDFFASLRLTALRRCKSKSVQTPQPAVNQGSSSSSGALATYTPLNVARNGQQEPSSTKALADDGTKNNPGSQGLFGATRSSFLGKYSYSGAKQQETTDKTVEAEDPKHSRKRPSPEVIGLTELPDNPSTQPTTSSHREGKRRKLDKHGREKPRKSERASSQAFDDARKQSPSLALLSRKHSKDARSRTSRKSKDPLRRKVHKERRKERHKDRERERSQKAAQTPSLESLLRAQQEPRHRASRQDLDQRKQQADTQQTSQAARPQPRPELSQPVNTQRPVSQLLQQAKAQQSVQEARPEPRPELAQGFSSGQRPVSQVPEQHRQEDLTEIGLNATLSRKQALEPPKRPKPQPVPPPQLLRDQVQRSQKGTSNNQAARANGLSGGGLDIAKIRDREITNAIKYRAPTAFEKARAKLDQINATTQSAQQNSGHLSISDLENDADLFQHFASKEPEKRTAQFVSSLPNLSGQPRPNGLHRATGVPALPPPPVTSGSRQVSNLAKSGNIFQSSPAPQPRFTTQARAESQLNELRSSGFLPLPLRRTQQQQQKQQQQKQQQQKQQQQKQQQQKQQQQKQQQQKQQQQQQRTIPQSFHQEEEEEEEPLVPLPHRETVSALEALGPDRTVIQYVVYRTPRFTPPLSTTQGGPTPEQARLLQNMRKEKAIRCSAHLNLQQANSQAAARQDRIRKGVVGKGWSMNGSRLSSSSSSSNPSGGATSATSAEAEAQAGRPSEPQPAAPAPQLYSGQVSFDNGEVQFFWVDEEMRDLGGVVAGVSAADMARAGGWVRVDKQGARIYKRKRFDVWSRVYWPRVKKQCRGGAGQRVVFECGGDSKGEEGEDKGGEGGTGKEGEERENMDSEERGGEGKGGEEVAGGDENGGTEGTEVDRPTDGNSAEETNAEEIEEGEAGADADEHSLWGGNADEDEAEDVAEPAGEAKNGNQDDANSGTEAEKQDTDQDTPAERTNENGEEDAAQSVPQPAADSWGQRVQRAQQLQGLKQKEATADESDSDDPGGTSDDDGDAAAAPKPAPRSPSPANTEASASSKDETVTPVDLIVTATQLHGTYTTLAHANRAALNTFLELTKPKNRTFADNFYYREEVVPRAKELFEEKGWEETSAGSLRRCRGLRLASRSIGGSF